MALHGGVPGLSPTSGTAGQRSAKDLLLQQIQSRVNKGPSAEDVEARVDRAQRQKRIREVLTFLDRLVQGTMKQRQASGAGQPQQGLSIGRGGGGGFQQGGGQVQPGPGIAGLLGLSQQVSGGSVGGGIPGLSPR